MYLRPNGLYLRGHSTRSVRPTSKLAYKRHILRMLTSPRNDFCCPKLYRLSCMLVTSTPPKYRFRGQFFGACKPHAATRTFLTGVRFGTPIHVCFFKHDRNCGGFSITDSVVSISRKAPWLGWENTFFGLISLADQLRGCTLVHLYGERARIATTFFVRAKFL